MAEPERVTAVRTKAREAGFGFSCEDHVGQLLAVLACAVQPDGRILEIGTGAGVGTAWMVHGLGQRTDVELITVEADAATAALAQYQSWPGYVRFVLDDAVRALPVLGSFDLVFADAQGGKWERLDLSIEALKTSGIVVVDDMAPQDWWTAEHAAKQAQVRTTLLERPDLVTCELTWAGGLIVGSRQLGSSDHRESPR